MTSVGSGDLDLETWSITEDNLVDNSLVMVLISDGDFVGLCSVLFLVIELVDNLFVIVVISDGGFMHFCSVLLFEIVELETWLVTEDDW